MRPAAGKAIAPLLRHLDSEMLLSACPWPPRRASTSSQPQLGSQGSQLWRSVARGRRWPWRSGCCARRCSGGPSAPTGGVRPGLACGISATHPRHGVAMLVPEAAGTRCHRWWDPANAEMIPAPGPPRWASSRRDDRRRRRRRAGPRWRTWSPCRRCGRGRGRTQAPTAIDLSAAAGERCTRWSCRCRSRSPPPGPHPPRCRPARSRRRCWCRCRSRSRWASRATC